MTRTLLVLVVLIAGFGVGFLSLARRPAASGQPSARKVLFYQDSMHPWIKSDSPGKCTVCGMDLTPILEGDRGFDAGPDVVALSPNSISVVHVQTEEVKRQPLVRTLRVAGTLEADETKKTFVAAPAAGRIDDLMVKYAGLEVREGERLATFYSPELTLEKRRFLVRARMSTHRDPTGGLAQPLSDADPYFSDLICPQTGTVVERNVYEGQYVADGEKLFTIVDLSALWFRFDVYEQQIPWVAVGQSIEVSAPSVPGKVFPAVITFIEPMINESTRTFKVRAEVQNPVVARTGAKQRLLGLGVYAEGAVQAQVRDVLAIPRSAVLSPGSQTFVYVDKGDGAYARRRVTLGRLGDAMWEVAGGLEGGERVVTSGNVLIDAQAQFSQTPHTVEALADSGGDSATHAHVMPASAFVSTASTVEATTTESGEMSGVPAAGGRPASPRPAETPGVQAAERSRLPAPPSKAAPPQGHMAMRPSASSDGPGFRNNRLGGSSAAKYDARMDAVFSRALELRATESAEAARTQAAESSKLTSGDCRKLQALLTAADKIGQALAADDVAQFNQGVSTCTNRLADLKPEMSAGEPWASLRQSLASMSRLQPAQDLAAARKQFLPFSTATVELVKQIKKQDRAFAHLKVYHCPMAPKPGLWIQATGPLANPFYGKEMLRCGEEMKL